MKKYHPMICLKVFSILNSVNDKRRPHPPAHPTAVAVLLTGEGGNDLKLWDFAPLSPWAEGLVSK